MATKHKIIGEEWKQCAAENSKDTTSRWLGIDIDCHNTDIVAAEDHARRKTRRSTLDKDQLTKKKTTSARKTHFISAGKATALI